MRELQSEARRPEAAGWIGRHGTFVLAHTAAAGRVGVMLCPPFGWEEVASYPVRRAWARGLEAAGFPAVRLDWPGAGDSGEAPRDPDRLDAWCDGLDDVAGWLRTAVGVDRVAVLGLGFGGLIALEAVRRGTQVEDLIVWGTPRDGQSFIRGELAFSRLQEHSEDSSLVDGLESSGYVITGPTLDAVRSLPGWLDDPGSLERVLLLTRDEVALPPEHVARWAALGIELRTEPGPGYGAMVSAPHRAEMPDEVIELVRDWLRAAPGGVEQRAGAPASEPGELDLGEARERVLSIPGVRGRSFGIVTEPERREPGSPTIVFLPVWAERRSGPNRMWTESARRLAELGAPSLRVDLPGIGDATGDPAWLGAPINVNDPGIIREVRAVLDAAQAAGLGDDFRLVGLCASANWAVQGLVADPRVHGALAVNFAHIGMLPLRDRRALGRALRRMLQPETWRRIVTREVRLSSLAASVAKLMRVWGTSGGDAEEPALRGLETVLGPLEARQVPVVFAFTRDEPLRQAFAAPDLRSWLGERPQIRVEEVAANDHSLRPLSAQVQVSELIAELVRPGGAAQVPRAATSAVASG